MMKTLRRRSGRRRVDARQELADVVDLVVGGGVDLDHVERPALADRDARLARVARLAVDAGSVQLTALARMRASRRLAGAARPDEQEAVAHPVGADGVAERLDDRFLADHLAECLRAPAAIEGLVRGRLGITALPGRDAANETECRAPSVDQNVPVPTARAARTRPFRGTRR